MPLRFMAEMRLALYQAGQAARALQGQVTAEHKAPDSVHQQSTAVSLADRLCQEIILLRAHALVPEIEAHSEELDGCPDEIRALFADNRHRYALIVDPIDGTDDYLAGAPTYGQMAGLLDQETGRMACGMVHFPAEQRTLLGAPGLGAWESLCLRGRYGRCRRRRLRERWQIPSGCSTRTMPGFVRRRGACAERQSLGGL